MVRVGADTKDMERGLKSARAKMKAFGGQMRKIGKVAAIAGAAVAAGLGATFALMKRKQKIAKEAEAAKPPEPKPEEEEK